MVTKRGASYQATVYIDGRRVRRSFTSLEEAVNYEKTYGKATGTLGGTLPTIARQLWAGTRDERNALRIADELVARLGPDTKLSELSDPMVTSLENSLTQAGNSPATVNTKLTRLSKLLKAARRQGHNFTMPFIGRQKAQGRRLRFLLPEEQERVFARLRAPEARLALFLIETGARVSEALKLEWRDVTAETATFTLTKGGKDRTVPLTEQARQALVWDGDIKPARPFGLLDYETFYRGFKRAVDQAGIDRPHEVVVHTLRHTCASRLVQGGLDIRAVQEWLGHASIQTTLRYAHLSPERLKAGLAALERMRNTA